MHLIFFPGVSPGGNEVTLKSQLQFNQNLKTGSHKIRVLPPEADPEEEIKPQSPSRCPAELY